MGKDSEGYGEETRAYKKMFTIKQKATVHVIRTHKKYAFSRDEAKQLVRDNPEHFLHEEKISSEAGTMEVFND